MTEFAGEQPLQIRWRGLRMGMKFPRAGGVDDCPQLSYGR